MTSAAFSDALRIAVMRAPSSDAVVAEVLLHLEHERAGLAAIDRQRVVDLGQVAVLKCRLDDDALDLLDAADVGLGLCCSHKEFSG